MPLVTATPVAQSDGSIIRQTVEVIETTTRTYTFSGLQESLEVWNKGNVNLTLNVGTYTSQTILPGATWKNDVLFTSLTLAAASGTCETRITSKEYDNVPVTRTNPTRVTIGTGSTTDATNPETLLVDFGTSSSFNAIAGKGTINNYLQLNIQNKSNGATASSDIVATADNGTESTNFVDLGINGSAFTGSIGVANDAYLYSQANNFIVQNNVANKDLLLVTTGTGAVKINGSVAVREVSIPGTASSTGSLGDIAVGGGYIYICTATNTWMRAAIATF